MKRTLAFAAWALLCGSAQAHAFLVDASPKVGGALKAAPAEISLNFSEWTEPANSSIALFDAAGKAVPIGPVKPKGEDTSVLTAAIKTPLAPGAYVVRWSAFTDDRHRTAGDFKFNVK